MHDIARLRGLARQACASPRLVAVVTVLTFFVVGGLREMRMLRPTPRPTSVVVKRKNKHKHGKHKHSGLADGARAAPVGTEALLPSMMLSRNRTTFVLPNGHCVQRAMVLPSLSCSLPKCNGTRREGKLRVLTNRKLKEWVSYLRFELADFGLRAGAQLVDVELQLTGTGLCHNGANFTHQLHLLRATQVPAAITLNRPYPRRLTAQWSRMNTGENFRVPLNLNGRQLLTLARHRRLNFALSEKLYNTPTPIAMQARKELEDACSYYSGASAKGHAVWPRLHISYTWRCCADAAEVAADERRRRRRQQQHGKGRWRRARSAAAARSSTSGGGGGSGHAGDAHEVYSSAEDAAESVREDKEEEDEEDAEAEGGEEDDEGGGGSSDDGEGGVYAVARPPWVSPSDWARLPRQRRLPMPWHSSLAAEVPPWVFEHSNDASAEACAAPRSRAEASGGQLGVPAGERPTVSFIVAYKENENMTARAMEALWGCASELPSAEYLFVDDGSEVLTGELLAYLAHLSRTFGIRYELMRYPVSNGFTLATSEAAQRANGTFLFFLNNDAFMKRWALRAILDTFSTHSDVGVVGAKLVGKDDAVQEAGAIIWADASGAWFNKHAPLHKGKLNEANHRLNYLRETDYVSAAVAMVPRELFVTSGMFDFHFSPGYYEDTDLSFTVRAKGLRVLYSPFAHVVHSPHSTYQDVLGSMDHLLLRNKAQFASKWRHKLLGHMPPCNVAQACWSSKDMYTHLAATRMYTYRVLWMDMVLPEPDRDSGSVRTLTMLKILLAMRCHVSIVSVQRSGKGRHERYMRMLQFLGVHVIPSFKLMKSLEVREPYDFIIVARRDTYAAARELLHRHYPNTLLVADTVDLHFLRERARQGFIEAHHAEPRLLTDVFGEKRVSSLANSSEGARLRELELDYVGASSVAIVVSAPERAALRAEMALEGRDTPPVVVIANAHEPIPPTTTPYASRHGVVFVGNFNHLPNRDAVLFFAREVMPRLMRMPRVIVDTGFVFHVVGANAIPSSILALNGSADASGVVRVHVHGFVPSLRPLYATMRISVAPLRWGAGVKGKVNTAHQLGVPVVATPVAVDGMHAFDGTHVLLGTTPEELAAATLRAYYDAPTWRRLARSGPRLVEIHFSASRAATGLLSVLAHLRDANTLMGMKSLALSSARPRIYSDLRAAALLGGYYFNLTSLAPHLDFTDDALPDDNYTCTASGEPLAPDRTPVTTRRAADGSTQQVLQRIAAAGF